MRSGLRPLPNGGIRCLRSACVRSQRPFTALTYLDTLRAEERFNASAIVRGQGWRRVLIDHSTFGEMAACDHILDAAFEHFRSQQALCKKTFRSACGSASAWPGDRQRDVESGIYDEGVAHAEVPTSSVRVCWW